MAEDAGPKRWGWGSGLVGLGLCLLAVALPVEELLRRFLPDFYRGSELEEAKRLGLWTWKGVLAGIGLFLILGQRAWRRLWAPEPACAGGLDGMRPVRRDVVIAVALALGSGALRAVWVGRSLVIDELSTGAFALSRGPLGIGGIHDSLNNHILYSLLVWMGTQVLGPDALALRLPALLAGALLPALTWLTLRRAGLRQGALLGALLLAISAPAIAYATDGRGYSLASCLGVLATERVLAALATNSRVAWAGFAVAGGLAFLAHATAALVVIGLPLAVVAGRRLPGGRTRVPDAVMRKLFAACLLLAGILGLTYGHLVFDFLLVALPTSSNLEQVRGTPLWLTVEQQVLPGVPWWVAGAFLGLVAAGGALAIVRCTLGGLVLVGPIALCLVATTAADIELSPRFWRFGVPMATGLAAAAIAGVDRLSPRRLQGGLLIAAFLAWGFVQWRALPKYVGMRFWPFREAAEVVNSVEDGGPVFAAGAAAAALGYLCPKIEPVSGPGPLEVADTRGQRWRIIVSDPSPFELGDPYRDRLQKIRAWLEEHGEQAEAVRVEAADRGFQIWSRH